MHLLGCSRDVFRSEVGTAGTGYPRSSSNRSKSPRRTKRRDAAMSLLKMKMAMRINGNLGILNRSH